MGMKEELKLFFSVGAFLLSVAALAVSIRVASSKISPAGSQIVHLENEPVTDPEKAEEMRQKKMMEEFNKQEEESLKKKKEYAEAALMRLKKEFKGNIPDTIVLATEMEAPTPYGIEKKEMVKPLPIFVDVKNKRIEFLGLFHQSERKGGIVEVFLSSTIGKLEHRGYEAVSVTRINPYDLWLALLLIGMEPARGVFKEGEAIELKGDTVDILCHWLEPDGTERSACAEDFIYSTVSHRTLERDGWVFIGSRVLLDKEEEKEFLATDVFGDLILVVHHPLAILDIPSKEGGRKDDVFIYNGKLLPAAVPAIATPSPFAFLFAEDEALPLISMLTKMVITPHKRR
ncbi:MAG: YdjY domain-containing protein [Planctomycetota bacterium]|nr:YdjY domain-containing protein [Planctomycetota bacterium]